MEKIIFTQNRRKLEELEIPHKTLITEEGIYYEVYAALLSKEEIDAITD